jgi:hypothetical protein
MFGIDGYTPQWQRGLTTIRDTDAARLSSLANLELTQLWLVWDLADDEWFSDCPVLLDFEGTQLEICHSKFDDLSITWNTINPRTPLAWTAFPTRWRHDADPRTTPLLGQPLQSIELLEWSGADLAAGMIAPSFTFPTGRLTIHNALDENALSFTTPDPAYPPPNHLKENSPASSDVDVHLHVENVDVR